MNTPTDEKICINWENIKTIVASAKVVADENRMLLLEQRRLEAERKYERLKTEKENEMDSILSPESLIKKMNHAVQYGHPYFKVIDSIPSTEWHHCNSSAMLKANSLYAGIASRLMKIGLVVELKKEFLKEGWGGNEYFVSMWASFS